MKKSTTNNKTTTPATEPIPVIDAGIYASMNAHHKCDKCGSLQTTLYGIDGSLICSGCVPFSYRHGVNARKMLGLSVSGSRAILAARKRLEAK